MSETSVELKLRSLGDHQYLVEFRSEALISESEFLATPAVLEKLGVDGVDERRVIRETAAFLLDHQPVVDLPPVIELEDVVAAYDGYLDDLRQRLTR